MTYAHFGYKGNMKIRAELCTEVYIDMCVESLELLDRGTTCKGKQPSSLRNYKSSSKRKI